MKDFIDKGFKGVYAIDEISKITTSNKMGVMLNLDKSNQPESHWVALYINAKIRVLNNMIVMVKIHLNHCVEILKR